MVGKKVLCVSNIYYLTYLATTLHKNIKSRFDCSFLNVDICSYRYTPLQTNFNYICSHYVERFYYSSYPTHVKINILK